jgi:hypothetical protein
MTRSRLLLLAGIPLAVFALAYGVLSAFARRPLGMTEFCTFAAAVVRAAPAHLSGSTKAPQDARERAFVAAARTVVAFLRGDAEFRALQLADTVVFHLAPESGGGVAQAAADDLGDRAAWRVRSHAGHTYVLVPPANLPRLKTRFGRHLKCFEYDLAGVVPQLARLPHVGAMLEPEDSTSCLQTWNFTFVFDAHAWPPRLTAVVYDQWEW